MQRGVISALHYAAGNQILPPQWGVIQFGSGDLSLKILEYFLSPKMDNRFETHIWGIFTVVFL
jgi:hypothetical protein